MDRRNRREPSGGRGWIARNRRQSDNRGDKTCGGEAEKNPRLVRSQGGSLCHRLPTIKEAAHEHSPRLEKAKYFGMLAEVAGWGGSHVTITFRNVHLGT